MKKHKITIDSKNPPRGATDWARIDAMSDEEVEQAALADPDAQPMTDEQLSRMARVPNVKLLREKLGMTQEEFADSFCLALGTVRDWEQERYRPDQSARTLLRLIAKIPNEIKTALAHQQAS